MHVKRDLPFTVAPDLAESHFDTLDTPLQESNRQFKSWPRALPSERLDPTFGATEMAFTMPYQISAYASPIRSSGPRTPSPTPASPPSRPAHCLQPTSHSELYPSPISNPRIHRRDEEIFRAPPYGSLKYTSTSSLGVVTMCNRHYPPISYAIKYPISVRGVAPHGAKSRNEVRNLTHKANVTTNVYSVRTATDASIEKIQGSVDRKQSVDGMEGAGRKLWEMI